MLLATDGTSRRAAAAIALGVVLAVAWPTFAGADEATDYELAYAMFGQEQYDFARAEFARFMLAYPDSDLADQALYLASESERMLGLYEQAAAGHRRLLNDYPNSDLRIDAMHGVGQAWFDGGRYDESILAFEKVTAEDVEPVTWAVAQYHIAEAHYRLGVYDLALAAYDALLARGPQPEQAEAATYGKAWAEFQLRRYAAARDSFLLYLATAEPGATTIEASFRAAECLFILERWDDARQAYAAFVAANEGDADARDIVADAALRVGHCLQRMGDTDAARVHYGNAALLYPDQEAGHEAQYWVGEVLYQSGRYAEAIPEYERLLSAHPSSPLASQTHYSIGRSRFAIEDYGAAVASFDAVVSADDGQLAEASTWYLGECRRLLREYNLALIWYRRVPSSSPSAADARLGMGASHFALGELAEAVDAYATLAAMDGAPLQRDALYHLGVAHYNAGSYAPAAEALARFLEGGSGTPVSPTDGALYWRLRALYEQQLYSEAVKAGRELVANHAESEHVSATRFYLGESLYWQEAYTEARAEYEALVAADADGEWAERARYHIGWTYFAAAQAEPDGDFSNAIKAWRALSDRDGGAGVFAAQALYDIGVAQLNSRAYDEAIQTFLRVLARFPDSEWSDDARYRVAWAHYVQEDYEEARRVFDEFLLRHPGSDLAPEAIYHKATCHFHAARYYEAIAEYIRVSEQYPTAILTAKARDGQDMHIREEALYQIGESYYNLGEYGEAVAAYGRLQGLYPKSSLADDAQYAIATAYELQGETDAALAAYRAVASAYPSSNLAPEALHMVGVQFYDAGSFQEAIAELQRVVNEYADAEAAPRAQYDIGRSYYRLRSHEHAVRACERAAANPAAKPDLRASAMYLAAWILQDPEHPERDVDRSSGHLARLVEEYPSAAEAPRAYLLLAELAREQDRPEAAVQSYRDLLGSYPDADEARAAMVDLGATLLQLGRHSEALEAVTPITSAASEYTPALVVNAQLVAGDALSGMRRYEDAAREYLVVALVPTYSQHSPFAALQALSRTGDAYERASRPDLAVKWYDTAISSYSGHPDRVATWTEFLDFAASRRDALQQPADGGE